MPFRATRLVLLESADQGRVGRYSFIGYRPRKVLRWSLGDDGDPTGSLPRSWRDSPPARLPGLPPFAGGAVGCFAYDLVRSVEPLGEPNPDPIGVPDLALMLTDVLVVFDHLKHTVTVIANVYVDEDLDAHPTSRRWRPSPRCAGISRGRFRPDRAPPPEPPPISSPT